MTTTIALLQLWSVVTALLWLRLVRWVASRLDPQAIRRKGFGVGYLLGGSFAGLVVFLLALGRPLPWLVLDVYETSGSLAATLLFEHLLKWGVLLLGIFAAGATNSKREGMEHAALVAVGFALTQNSFYFIRYPDLAMLLRPLFVTGVEAMVASLWGYVTVAFYLRGGVARRLLCAQLPSAKRCPMRSPGHGVSPSRIGLRNGIHRLG